jgi:hypothetical protein
MTGMHHHAQLFSVDMGSHKFFLPVLAWNLNPPMIGMGPWHRVLFYFAVLGVEPRTLCRLGKHLPLSYFPSLLFIYVVSKFTVGKQSL